MPRLNQKINDYYSDNTGIDAVIYSQNLLFKGPVKSVSEQYTSKTLSTCPNDLEPKMYIHSESPKRHIISITKVSSGNVTIEFLKGISLTLKINFEDGFYIAYDDLFGVYGSGISDDSAYEDFKESFVDFYKDVMKLPEESVGESTIKLRNSLKQFTSMTVNE